MSSSNRILPGPMERSLPKSSRKCSDVFAAAFTARLVVPRPIAAIMRWDVAQRQMLSSGGLVADDGLGLQKFLEAPLAVLAAVARLLVAAERRRGVARGIVQVHVAGPHLRGDRAGVADVGRLHVRRQPVDRLVGQANDLFLAFVGQDGDDRSEDLLARDRHVVAHAREHGGPPIVAAVEMFRPARAAGHQLAALVAPGLDEALALLVLAGRDDRTEPGFRAAWVA